MPTGQLYSTGRLESFFGDLRILIDVLTPLCYGYFNRLRMIVRYTDLFGSTARQRHAGADIGDVAVGISITALIALSGASQEPSSTSR